MTKPNQSHQHLYRALHSSKNKANAGSSRNCTAVSCRRRNPCGKGGKVYGPFPGFPQGNQYTCSRWFVIIPQMKHASSRAVAVTASGFGFRTAMERYFRFMRSFPLFAYAITLGSLPAWRFNSSEDVLPGKERA